MYATRRLSLRLQLSTLLAAAAWFAPICWWYCLPVFLAPCAAALGGMRLRHRSAAPAAQRIVTRTAVI
jgi:hypothetical protein